MKVYTYSQARQQFSSVLDQAEREEVIITRKGGKSFIITVKEQQKSPFEVPSIKSQVTTADILSAVRESRES